MPPTLFVCNTDSLAERIQAAFPETKVVKALNTVTAQVMVNPRQLTGDHDDVRVRQRRREPRTGCTASCSSAGSAGSG